jgi:hypothetical protein
MKKKSKHALGFNEGGNYVISLARLLDAKLEDTT